MSCFFGHDWTKWEVYEEKGFIRLNARPNTPVEYIEVRQRRNCEGCGFSEDRLVKKGYLTK
jgi:hypothetical protein